MSTHFISPKAACAGMAVGLLLALGASGAQAGRSQAVGAPAPNTVIGGSSVVQTLFVYDEPNSTVGSSVVYTLLPGMSAPLTIGGARKLVIATFGAESACYGGDKNSPDWCVTRILARDGVNEYIFQPTSGNGTDFAFDSTDSGTETSASWEAHQMTRGRVLKPGTYKIEVEARVKQFGVATPTFWTGERTLTVQVVNVP
jgi:hypothetical protein